MQFGGAASERRGAREIPVLERDEQRRRRIEPLARLHAFAVLGPFASRDALVVAPQLVDREIPPGSLMLYAGLDDGQRARLEAGAQVLERADERRNPRELPRRQEAADLEFRIRRRFDAAEQLEHGLVVDEGDAVALIRAAARPLVLLRRPGEEGRRVADPGALDAPAPGGDFVAALDEREDAAARVVVHEAVDERALARAGNPREDRRRRRL